MINYLRGTLELPLTLQASNTNIMKRWVEGSYGIQPDSKSQTGGTQSIRKGSIISSPTKPNLHTRSYTETELVAADDLMPQLCWTNYFLDAKDYGINSTIMYQDHHASYVT